MDEIDSSGLTEREQLEHETDMSFFVASGPGGQHRNRTATGVRLVHRPTGIVVTATERRSQALNREVAFARLAARLAEAQEVTVPRIATRPSRLAQLKRRNEKRKRGERKQLRRPPRDD